MKESLPGTMGPSRKSLDVIRPKDAFPPKVRLGGVGFVPVLHEHGEDVVALLLQEEGGDGGVHAAGQADADFDFAIFRGGSCHFVRFSPAKVMISKNISYF